MFIFYPVHYSLHSLKKQLNQQFTTVTATTTTTMYSSLESDTDFYDDFQDISSGEKRIVRVGTKTFDKTGAYIAINLYKKNEDGVFKCYQAVTLSTKEFDCLADNYSKILKKMAKNKQVKRLHLLPPPPPPPPQLQMINIIIDDTRQNDQSVPKNNVLKVVMKTMRMMNTRIIKSVELPETEKKRLNNLI